MKADADLTDPHRTRLVYDDHWLGPAIVLLLRSEGVEASGGFIMRRRGPSLAKGRWMFSFNDRAGLRKSRVSQRA